MSATKQTLEVRREALDRTRIVEEALAPAAAGEVVLRIERFALTANNITYAVTGDLLGYWQFFPSGDEGWGCIPVWGFAEVQDSALQGVEPGDRYYGYFPIATHLTVRPAACAERGFSDAAVHRQSLPAVYNYYQRCAADPLYRQDQEAMLMLFRPLFTTSFFIDDFLADRDFFGARTVLLSSASSKTAFGLAWLLHRRGAEQCRVLGLTSAANRDFVTQLGCYHQVLAYDQLDNLPPGPVLYVDMAGNADLRAAIHQHYREQLKYSCAVGVTHRESAVLAGGAMLPGPSPEMFFAPTQVQKRSKEWGPEVLAERLAAAWQPFTQEAGQLIEVSEGLGAQQVDSVYHDLLHNRADPSLGYILTMAE